MKKQEMNDLDLVKAPADFDPIAAQKDLQRKIIRRMTTGTLDDLYLPMTDEMCDTQGHLTEIVAANVTAIQQELAELLDWLPWKWWKDYNGQQYCEVEDEQALEMKYEVVDIAHFLFNIAIALGMDYQEFLDIYATKQAENHARQERGY